MKFNPKQQGEKEQRHPFKKAGRTSTHEHSWKNGLSSEELWNLPEFSDDDSIDSINNYDSGDEKAIKPNEAKSKKTKREKKPWQE